MNRLRILLATLLVAATYPLSAGQLAPARDIRALMQRVNAWQLAHPRMKADNRNWERGTWYAGVTEAQRATGDEKFLPTGMVQWGQQVGDCPSSTRQAESHEYVTGAFLLAASEAQDTTCSHSQAETASLGFARFHEIHFTKR